MDSDGDGDAGLGEIEGEEGVEAVVEADLVLHEVRVCVLVKL